MSFGACSPSNSSQSKPAFALISAVSAEVNPCQKPVSTSPRFRAARNSLRGAPFSVSDEVTAHLTKWPVIGYKIASGRRLYRTDERTGEDDVTGGELAAI